MKAVIMAGGKGSRLKPLTIGCAKPMVSFINKPVLDHILHLLKQHHINEVIITVQYLANQIQSYLGNGRHLGMTIHYAVEEFPLGTAGSVKNAQPYLDDKPFLVISGDAITDINLSELLRFHKEKRAMATLALKQVKNPHEFGVVVADDNGCIEQYLEKPGGEQAISNVVNTGIYVLDPGVLALMEPGQVYDFSLDIFPYLLKQKALFGCLVDGYWRDVGTIQNYLKAMADAVAGKVSCIALEPASKHYPNNGFHSLKGYYKEQPMLTLLKNQKILPVYWSILGLVAIVCDYAMGPFIQFPFLFILPVVLASWYNGKWWGVAFALTLPLARLYFSTFWIVPWSATDVAINTVIRISVLLLIVYLVDRAAAQNRALTYEVQTLKGLLPICSFCKKIRNEDNTWESLELYISNRSEAQFSHGMCPECAKEHYPEFFKGSC